MCVEGLQAEVYARVEAVAGKKIAYDVPLVGMQTEPGKHIGNIARAMGICEAAASDVELHKMIQAMGELLGRDHGACVCVISRTRVSNQCFACLTPR